MVYQRVLSGMSAGSGFLTPNSVHRNEKEMKRTENFWDIRMKALLLSICHSVYDKKFYLYYFMRGEQKERKRENVWHDMRKGNRGKKIVVLCDITNHTGILSTWDAVSLNWERGSRTNMCSWDDEDSMSQSMQRSHSQWTYRSYAERVILSLLI